MANFLLALALICQNQPGANPQSSQKVCVAKLLECMGTQNVNTMQFEAWAKCLRQ